MIEYKDDNNIAVFNGLTFIRDKQTGYYLNSKTHKRLHVYVWEYHNGIKPQGYHVHHKDLDKQNNNIDNLILLTPSEHAKLHSSLWDDERKEKQVELINQVRDKAKDWHKSDAGRQWHKNHYEANKDKLHKKIEITCQICGKEVVVTKTGHNKFCSNACKSTYRRRLGVDNENRVCTICGAVFTTNKYSKAKTCSTECKSKLRVSTKNR